MTFIGCAGIEGEEAKMYAVRRVLRVKDSKIVLDLPDFPSEYAEIIVLPTLKPDQKTNGGIALAQSESTQAINLIQAIDATHLTQKQMAARERTLALLAEKTLPGAPRRLGIFDGLVEIADDFNAPLPDEEIYWGSLTDEYGVNTDK